MKYQASILSIGPRARSIIVGVVVAIPLIELAGIWNELHHIRNEQVKNALYALPADRQSSISSTVRGKNLQSTVHVTGSVEVDGPVKLDEPVEVNLDR